MGQVEIENINKRIRRLERSYSGSLKGNLFIALSLLVLIMDESGLLNFFVDQFRNLSENWQIALFTTSLTIGSSYYFYRLGTKRKSKAK